MKQMLDLEKLEVLDGSRAGGRTVKQKASVRIEDLIGLFEVPDKLKSTKAAGDPPTQAEFNALWEDVNAVHQRLIIVSRALTRRLV